MTPGLAKFFAQQRNLGYDAFDRLIAKQVDATGDGTYESAKRYVYDGVDIVLVTDETGSLTNRYLHGPAIDQIFADERLGEDVRWALSDNQGTVRDWSARDATSGTTSIVDHLDYDAYGQITAHTDPATGQASTDAIHYAYTGREWDADVGQYYYRARWYDPRAGRFISEDPLGFAAGDANVQRYVGNHPNLARDPSGLEEGSLQDLFNRAQNGQLTSEEEFFFLLHPWIDPKNVF